METPGNTYLSCLSPVARFFLFNDKTLRFMETTRIQTRSGRISPEQLACRLEQLAQKIRQASTLVGTVETTPYGSMVSCSNGSTALTLSVQKGGGL